MTAQPLSLDDLERLGATRFGRGVRRVVLIHDDGRKVSIDLPTAFAEPKTEDQLRESKIIEFINAFPAGHRVKGNTIAAELDEEYDTIRKLLSSMVSREILYAKQGVSGYSRGAKFPLNQG